MQQLNMFENNIDSDDDLGDLIPNVHQTIKNIEDVQPGDFVARWGYILKIDLSGNDKVFQCPCVWFISVHDTSVYAAQITTKQVKVVTDKNYLSFIRGKMLDTNTEIINSFNRNRFHLEHWVI